MRRERIMFALIVFVIVLTAVLFSTVKAYSDGWNAGFAEAEQQAEAHEKRMEEIEEITKEAEQEPVIVPIRVDKLPEPEEKTEFRAEDYILQSDQMTDPKEYAGVIMQRLPAGEWYSEDDLFCYAALIYQEAGGDKCSDDTRAKVAEVAGNRVEDPRFPNTIREVMEQSIDGALQYGMYAITGVQFSERAYLPEEWHAVQRAYRVALDYLMGANTGGLRGAGYIWQSENPQGTDQIWQDGVCFGKG